MNLSDITKINFGSAGISAVYNGGIKLWPKGSELSNKVMKFTTTDGNTWNNTKISAYTADNRFIQPVKKDATGWTYDEEVRYITSSEMDWGSEGNLLTFEGFPKAVKLKEAIGLFFNCTNCTDISTANMDTSECTDMNAMFTGCMGLTSLDLSNWDTSNVTNTDNMFLACDSLTTVKMTNCSQDTKDKIRAALDAAGLTNTVITE